MKFILRIKEMKSINKMSSKELFDLDRKKVEEETNESLNKPIKIGFLKEDLYEVSGSCWDLEESYYLKSETKTIKEKLFDKILSKGTKFICYQDGNEEAWYDMPKEWADTYLENIQELR